jgi:hypothetical protein
MSFNSHLKKISVVHSDRMNRSYLTKGDFVPEKQKKEEGKKSNMFKGTKQHAAGWDASSKDWAHMVLHLPHAEGDFGVPFNCVTKDAAFYTTTSRFVSWMGAFSQARQELWLPKDDLQDSSSWSSPPLMLLRDIHSKLIDQYDCEEVCAPSPSQVNAGARARPRSQDGVPPQQEAAPLSLPQLNRLFEASFARDESSASTAGVAVIPSQF